MDPLAQELNNAIMDTNPHIYQMLSEVGKNLFFPKGILHQSAEAREKAHRYNATIGMATHNGRPMSIASVMKWINLDAEKAITYAPAFGIPELRSVWKKYLYQKNPSLREKKISLPLVTHALTHGLSIVADMWVNPGDIIVLPDKMWGNYRLIFSIRRGAEITNYPLFDQENKFNLKEFEKTLKDQAQKKEKLIVILNFPNNPTGYSPTIPEAKEIKNILLNIAEMGTNLIVVLDDAYFGLVYEQGILEESLFAHLANEHQRLLAIKLDGATKEDFAWGLRVGFITYATLSQKDITPLYEALEKKTGGAIRGTISNANHLGQEILLNALKAPDYKKEKETKFNMLKERANEVKKVLANMDYKNAWSVYPFNSGYFMCIKVKTVNAEKLRKHLLNNYGIGLISLNNTDLRIAFSCIEKDNIAILFKTILKGIRDLEK
ncbi:MAG: hypothetical protein DRG39_00865 [Deltaproteobacteria bacterium]|nr:MAG: hypothetical protein DRG39_00865 [Deltaproteobacteria bacterium]